MMKRSIAACLLIVAFTCGTAGCKDESTPAGTENRTNLVARTWKGESFVTLTTGQSSRVVKDIVLLFDFKPDGSCILSQASYSLSSIAGQWKLGNEDAYIVITLNRPLGTVAETLPIKELSSARFVIGDTTYYGYSLVPK